MAPVRGFRTKHASQARQIGSCPPDPARLARGTLMITWQHSRQGLSLRLSWSGLSPLRPPPALLSLSLPCANYSGAGTHQLHQPSSAANAPVQLAVLTPDSQGTQRGAHCSADGGHRPAEAGIHGGRPWAGSPGRPGRKCSHPCGVSVVGVRPSKPTLWTLPLQAAGRHEPERKARGVPACLRACASSQAGRDRPVNTDGSRAPLRGILDLLSDSRRGIRAFRLPGGSATPLDNAAVQEIPRSHVTQL